jgi:hypothetical protein
MLSGIRKDFLSGIRNLLLYQLTKKVKKILILLVIVGYHCYQVSGLTRISSYMDEMIGNHQCGFRHNR